MGSTRDSYKESEGVISHPKIFSLQNPFLQFQIGNSISRIVTSNSAGFGKSFRWRGALFHQWKKSLHCLNLSEQRMSPSQATLHLQKIVSKLFPLTFNDLYKRDTQVNYPSTTNSHPPIQFSITLQSICYHVSHYLNLCDLMAEEKSYKEAILEGQSKKGDPSMETSVDDDEAPSPQSQRKQQPDLSPNQLHPEENKKGDSDIPLDELPQVQQDIEDLSKSCLLGKILGDPLDMRTIISRTKADWKMVKGDVEYL